MYHEACLLGHELLPTYPDLLDFFDVKLTTSAITEKIDLSVPYNQNHSPLTFDLCPAEQL